MKTTNKEKVVKVTCVYHGMILTEYFTLFENDPININPENYLSDMIAINSIDNPADIENLSAEIVEIKPKEQKNTRASDYIETKKVEFSYNAGWYSFMTKSCKKLFTMIYPILSRCTNKLQIAEYYVLVSCLWIVNHLSNKLEGISSISSSVHDNKLCKAWRKLKGCICAHCYAHNQQSYQTGLKEHNILNGIILRNVLIPVRFFKFLVIIFPYLRIESFGDTANVIQARNYIRIIKAFPGKRCAIWSKNIAIWEKAFSLEGKPKNTTYVHSSSYVNKPDNIDLSRYWFVDHIFTVYDKKYATEHNIIINCGGRKCIECIKKRINCYFRNNTLYINELLK